MLCDVGYDEIEAVQHYQEKAFVPADSSDSETSDNSDSNTDSDDDRSGHTSSSGNDSDSDSASGISCNEYVEDTSRNENVTLHRCESLQARR